jgi:hypothetical protein
VQVALRTLAEHLLSAHCPQLVALDPDDGDESLDPVLELVNELDEVERELERVPPPPEKKGLTRVFSKSQPDLRQPIIQRRDGALARFRDLVRGMGTEIFAVLAAVGEGCEACTSGQSRIEEHSEAAHVAVTASRALGLDQLRRSAEDSARALARLTENPSQDVREWQELAPEIGRVWLEHRLNGGGAGGSADETRWRDLHAQGERFHAYASALAEEMHAGASAKAGEHAARLESIVVECRAAMAELETTKTKAREAAHLALAAWSKRETAVAERAEQAALSAAAALARVESATGEIDSKLNDLDTAGERVDAVTKKIDGSIDDLQALQARMPNLMELTARANAVASQIGQAEEQLETAIAEAQAQLAAHADEIRAHRSAQTEKLVQAVKSRAAKAVKEFEGWLKEQAEKARPARRRR